MNTQFTFTLFPDLSGAQKTEHTKTTAGMVEWFQGLPVYPNKDACPLISMTLFGYRRTDKNSLRHDANILEATGAIGDYDAGEMAPATAATLLQLMGIEAIIVTTPSHGLKGNRWRVIAPFAQARTITERHELLGKLNTILGGALADESFTASQSFYAGCVAGVAYEVIPVSGTRLDVLPGVETLEFTGRPAPQPGTGSTDALAMAVKVASGGIEQVRAALSLIPNDGPDWNHWNRIGMAVYRATSGSDEGLEAWREWSDRLPYTGKTDDTVDARWRHYRSSPPTNIGTGTLVHLAGGMDAVKAILPPRVRVEPPADSAAWPELVPLDVASPARLPVELWPPMLREYAASAARETETPIELPAMLALGTVAAAVQRIIDVEIKPGYVEPCGIFTAISLPPAARKSAEFKRATRPLVQWEARKREQVAEQLKQAESLLRTHQDRCKELRKKASKAEGEQAEQLAQELAELEANEPLLPKPPRVFTSDVTTEHLATMMQDNGEALSVMSSEGGIFETMAGRYNQGVANIDLYLMGHAGDAVRVDRGSKPPVMLDDPRLSMVLAVQPDVLSALSNKPGFKGRGLNGRVLYVMPPSTLGKRTGDTPRMDPFSLANYEQAITRLLDLTHAGNLGPWKLQLCDDARAAWQELAQEVEAGLADGGRFEHCRDWAGKLPGAVARIAALFHAVRGVNTFTGQPITLEDMQAAIATGRALAEHALAAYSLMGADPDIEDAKLLLRWVQRRGLSEFTRREAHQNHNSRYKKADQLEPGLKVLEERGYIQQYQPPSSPAGGRPSTVYAVNPAV